MTLYPYRRRLEIETLAQANITREEMENAIRLYCREEQISVHMILGINGEGVLCSPIENWTPSHPQAFSSLVVVPWETVRAYRTRIKNDHG